MSADLSDFKQWSKAKNPKASPKEALLIAQRSEVHAKDVTGAPAWDAFLTYLQAAADQTEAMLEAWDSRLHSHETLDHAELLKAKLGYHETKSRLDTLRAVISLPKDLIENGEKATELLERMEHDAAA